jgi:hypothetical protein
MSVGGTLKVHNLVTIGSASIEYEEASGPNYYLRFYARDGKLATGAADTSGRAMTIAKLNNVLTNELHGTWTAENAVTTSDRRLKKDIRPLYLEMARAIKDLGPNAQTAVDLTSQTSVIRGVLKELRPVSYRFKNRAESKYSHFGFIAQELEEILPDVVHRSAEGLLSVRYDDLIAVLTLGIQSIDARIWQLDARVSGLKATMDERLGVIQERVTSVESVVRSVIIAKKHAELRAKAQLSVNNGSSTATTKSASLINGRQATPQLGNVSAEAAVATLTV